MTISSQGESLDQITRQVPCQGGSSEEIAAGAGALVGPQFDHEDRPLRLMRVELANQLFDRAANSRVGVLGNRQLDSDQKALAGMSRRIGVILSRGGVGGSRWFLIGIIGSRECPAVTRQPDD